MGKRSVASNAILNVIRTALAVIAPLVTYPYVSRVLGAENLGKVNYVNSIVQYFVLISALGISTYGIREGAKKRDNKKQINQFISECFTINLIMAVVSLILLITIVMRVSSFENYRLLFLIEAFLVVFDLFGIEWVNTVFEDYLYITIRTIVVYVISIICTFVLVHSRNDYYIYAGLTVGTTGLVSLLNWIHCRKICSIKIWVTKNSKKHIKPILVFFANKLAVTLYVSSDTTMLGLMTSDYRVGIYSAAVKIYTIIKNLLAAIYAVCIPRLSSKIGKNDDEGFKDLYSELMAIMTLLIFPASIGLFLLAPNIILLLFGAEYADSAMALRILSFAIVFAIYGGLLSSVFNTSRGLEKISLQATIIAAVVNLGLNIVLIPIAQEKGAAFTTVLAEAITVLYCFFRSKDIRKFIDHKVIKKCLLEAVAGCIEILFITLAIRKLVASNVLCIIMSVSCSIVVYAITLIVLKDKFALAFLYAVEKKISKRGGRK